MGTTDLLSTTHLSGEQAEYVEVIRSSSDALLTIINDILDLSKIEAGRVELQNENFSIQSIVEDVADLLATAAHSKHLHLLTYIAPDLPAVCQGDPARLRQVLLNLAGNAIKFTERGDVTIMARCDTLVAQGDSSTIMARFEIQDTGIGVPQDQISRLFTPFTQLDGSNTRKHGGSGLGLAISKRLVELMGGEIDLQSQLGQGSLFWFSVPLTLTEQETEPEGLTGLHALCVIHHPAEREILYEYLTTSGVHVHSIAGGRNAVQRITRAALVQPSATAVILDMDLPEVDVLDLVHRIRQTPMLAHTPVVLLTTLAHRLKGNGALQFESVTLLNKPVRRRQLVALLSSIAASPPVLEGASTVEDVAYAPNSPINRLSVHAILLVEDNLVNQKVALRQLHKLGYSATAVTNGREAVEAALHNRYSLILMDCQMPEIDGFEATRIIRTTERNTHRHTPIVAMTANAMAGDREACLAAGMDDYLAKPIRIEELEEMIKRWHRTATAVAL